MSSFMEPGVRCRSRKTLKFWSLTNWCLRACWIRLQETYAHVNFNWLGTVYNLPVLNAVFAMNPLVATWLPTLMRARKLNISFFLLCPVSTR